MYEEIKYWYLRDHKLFRTLGFAQIRQLCIVTGFKKAGKGEILYFSNPELPRIFLLKKGHIKIMEVDGEGNETTKEVLKKGDLFGQLFLDVARAPSNEFAKTLTDDVMICSFLLSDFENLMVKHPQLALSYTKFIGLKMKRLKNNYHNLMFKDARSRLLIFLREWAESEGNYHGNGVTIENYLTQTDISQIICTTRQTVTQLLNELKTEGLLEYDRQKITIPDISRI
ncbi:MAG: Crp/Fnr family transcriptional regulator [Sediminicola sp.]